MMDRNFLLGLIQQFEELKLEAKKFNAIDDDDQVPPIDIGVIQVDLAMLRQALNEFDAGNEKAMYKIIHEVGSRCIQ